MRDTHSEEIALGPVLQAALSSRQPGEDLDEALLRALKAAHPEQAAALLPAVLNLIAQEAKRSHEDREQIAQRLAAGDAGGEVAARTTQIGPVRVSVQSTIYRAGGKTYHSLEELPPEVRSAVQAALSPGEQPAAKQPESQPWVQPMRDDRRPIRAGCSMAVLAALWRLVWR
jgi:hypothetical protein